MYYPHFTKYKQKEQVFLYPQYQVDKLWIDCV